MTCKKLNICPLTFGVFVCAFLIYLDRSSQQNLCKSASSRGNCFNGERNKIVGYHRNFIVKCLIPIILIFQKNYKLKYEKGIL